jgi:hypothetical protein
VTNSFIGIKLIRNTGNVVSSILLRPNSMLVSGIHIGVNLRAKDRDENK